MFRGHADWDRISEIKSHLKRIPLIGNGDLDTPQKVVAAFRDWNVDGVMIARASLNKPWLFRQAAAALRGEPIPPDPTIEEERALMLEHFRLVCERFGEERGAVLMRKFACCYAQGRRGAREFRKHVVLIETAAEDASRSGKERLDLESFGDGLVLPLVSMTQTRRRRGKRAPHLAMA